MSRWTFIEAEGRTNANKNKNWQDKTEDDKEELLLEDKTFKAWRNWGPKFKTRVHEIFTGDEIVLYGLRYRIQHLVIWACSTAYYRGDNIDNITHNRPI